MQELSQELLTVWTDYRYLIATAAYILWLAISWFVLHFIFAAIKKFTEKTENRLDDLILREARLPSWVIAILTGFYVVSLTVGLPQEIEPYISRFSQLGIVFIVIYFAVRLIINLLSFASNKNLGLRFMMPTFTRLANVLIWASGILILMDIFGISITPILASLGIAGLAVGLALQETLGNFFSGIYILVSQPVRVGDHIELENGLKGYVINIGWRETRIRTLPNNTVVIPNSRLSQSIITNYYLPQQEMACLVQVGVSYSSDLEKVEKVTIEVGKQVLEKVTGGVKTFTPFIRYHTFNDFSIDFTVILRINEFVDQYLITHEFVKALHKRYKEEGISIPFPIRTIEMKGNNNATKQELPTV